MEFIGQGPRFADTLFQHVDGLCGGTLQSAKAGAGTIGCLIEGDHRLAHPVLALFQGVETAIHAPAHDHSHNQQRSNEAFKNQGGECHANLIMAFLAPGESGPLKRRATLCPMRPMRPRVRGT